MVVVEGVLLEMIENIMQSEGDEGDEGKGGKGGDAEVDAEDNCPLHIGWRMSRQAVVKVAVSAATLINT